MKLFGIRPGRQVGDRVELPEQRCDQLVGVIAGAELFELVQHPGQRPVGIADGPFGEVLALLRETFPVPDELLPIEVGRNTDMSAQKPARADDPGHATPRLVHTLG